MKNLKKSIIISFLCVLTLCIGLLTACGGDKSALTFTYNEQTERYYVKATSTDISGEIEIPAEYEGKKVNIDSYAFKGCTKLTKITISEGITTIPIGAFHSISNCEIVIPVSVTSIALDAFNAGTNGNHDITITYKGTKNDYKTKISPKGIPTNWIIHCSDGDLQ